MKVIEFRIEESKLNKGSFVLIAKAEDGKEWVVSGYHHAPTYLVEAEKSSDVQSK